MKKMMMIMMLAAIAGCVPGVKYNHDAMEWQARALDFEEIQKTTMAHAELIIEDNFQLRMENQKLRDVVVILAEKLEMILKEQAQR